MSAPTKLEALRAQLTDETHLSKLALRIIDAMEEHVDELVAEKLQAALKHQRRLKRAAEKP